MKTAGELSAFAAGWHHFQQREFDSALTYLTRAITGNENADKACYLRGNIQLERKNFVLAISDYSAALAHNSKLVEALLNRGTAFQENGQMSAAMSDFTEAIAMRPKLFNGYFCRARLLQATKASKEALDDFHRALELSPGSIVIRNAIGSVYLELNDFATAFEIFDDIVADAPDYVPALSNRGAALKALSRPQEARCDFEKAARMAPDFATAYYNLGDIQREMGDYEPALENFLHARHKGHHQHSVNWSMGLCLLALGEYATGWDLFEDRLQVSEFTESAFKGHATLQHTQVRNAREDIISRRIFLAGEQGVGDCIMFLSILPDLVADAGEVFCQLDNRLIGLFSRCFPDVKFVDSGTRSRRPSEEADRCIRMGSLGYSYRRAIDAFPGTPYLTPAPTRVAQWKSRIPVESKKHVIGLSWRGGSSKTNGKNRSLTLAELAPLLDRDDCIFVSLQHGDVAAEIADFNAARTNKVLSFPPGDLHDFEDFAGLIGAVDYVVSIDNTTLHLCGALGKPCYALLSRRAEWRYGATGDTLPWYQSVKLFRQHHDGQWRDVIEKIDDALTVMGGTLCDVPEPFKASGNMGCTRNSPVLP